MSRDNIPFQVTHIMDSMLNTKENIHVRGNYRQRLDSIRTEITAAICKYDNEVIAADYRKKKA